MNLTLSETRTDPFTGRTGDWKVARTRRRGRLRYIISDYALI